MSRRLPLGFVRANSRAVDFPIPEEAPVMRMVLPSRRLAAAEDMVRVKMLCLCFKNVAGLKVELG